MTAVLHKNAKCLIDLVLKMKWNCFILDLVKTPGGLKLQSREVDSTALQPAASRGRSSRFGYVSFTVVHFRPDIVPSSVFFGCVRLVTVGVFGSNLRPQLLLETEVKKEPREKKENRRQEATDGVSRRNDGAAGTCPGKNTSRARCHERGAEYLWSPCCLLRPGLSGCSSPRCELFPRQRPHSPQLAARDVSSPLLTLKTALLQCGLDRRASFDLGLLTQC